MAEFFANRCRPPRSLKWRQILFSNQDKLLLATSLSKTIPQPVSNLILKLMAKNAEDRYQSAWGIKADLERCARQLAEMGQINAMSLALQDVSEQFHIPQKLYGREAEMEALLGRNFGETRKHDSRKIKAMVF